MFTIGNGGSAATASHIACDLANNVVRPPRRGFNALSLAENVATLSATANDHGYERVYANQLMSLGDPGDVLIAVSASGNSPNVLVAMGCARERGLAVLALLGADGGFAAPLADRVVIVPETDPGIVEDAHLAINHAITQQLRARLDGEDALLRSALRDG